MIEYREIRRLATKYQTREDNIVREYLQNLFLRSFYSQAGADSFLFKGGTALRIIYQSPRFSEDIDFSGTNNADSYENILMDVIGDFKEEGIEVSLIESKSTSGGWLAILALSVYGKKLEMRNEISFRKAISPKEAVLISSEFVPAYKVFVLHPQILVQEKINALLQRRKTRDFFDLYFILRNPELRKYVDLDDKKRGQIIELLEQEDNDRLKRQLKPWLPISFLPLLDNFSQKLVNLLK